MSELPREFIARYTAGGAVGIASVCSAHPEILINRLPFLIFTFAQVLAPKVIKRSAAVIKTTALALARAKVHWALPAYSFEGADG